MPPYNKIPKETVVYPASKRKAPPFKPLRPSTLPRISTTESESSIRTTTTKPPPPKRRKATVPNDDDDESDDMRVSGHGSDASEDLPANPLAAKPSKATQRPIPKRKPAARHVSPMSISSEEGASRQQFELDPDPPPGPSQTDVIPTIPQPLLVRLLHEHFADKATKIDKSAIQVLQKYFEVFIRETIARAAAGKTDDIEGTGDMDGLDVSWLELADLERVAGGMMLDF